MGETLVYTCCMFIVLTWSSIKISTDGFIKGGGFVDINTLRNSGLSVLEIVSPNGDLDVYPYK